MQVTNNGSRSLQLNPSATTPRTSARTDFGAQMRNGIAAGGGAAGQAIGVAAPFVPGAAVVSAAVSGAAGSVGGGGGGFAGQASGGVQGATSVGADGIPIGGSLLNSAQGGGSGAAGGGASGNSGMDMLNATKNMQEMAQSFNLQYLQLQEKMQSENRSFSTVSNVMKTKHDTAKSSISNVR